ncbi:MAG: helix-turn-helix domain-containing protein [Clostridiales bacterium]|nr:helix-turn-helix domain-containing protein [Clostridiales bacterium]
MDAQKFGSFIAALRKEKKMTQAELGQILHVTDKAVSKWERGIGLPDINLIEPLADALGVSVLEIMKSEKIEARPITDSEASEAIINSFDMVKEQRKQERKNIIKIVLIVFAITAVVLLIDSLAAAGIGIFFVFVFLPLACFIGGLSLLVYGLIRKKKKLPCTQAIVAGLILLLLLMFIFAFFFIGGILGLSPTPT